ncbi:hypothetical protein LCGC14_1330230 [marine sediment metagenome]|uniref:Uncharacterized protein n=1 Tax=marine sediment metagenome TaxID=412755 RepID=A0A0F9NJA5_9ZZZZ
MIEVRGAPTVATQDTAVVVNTTAGQYSWAQFQKLVIVQNNTGADMYIRLGDTSAPSAASTTDYHFRIPSGSPPVRITVGIRYLSIWVPTGGTWTYQGSASATVALAGWAENKTTVPV